MTQHSNPEVQEKNIWEKPELKVISVIENTFGAGAANADSATTTSAS